MEGKKGKRGFAVILAALLVLPGAPAGYAQQSNVNSSASKYGSNGNEAIAYDFYNSTAPTSYYYDPNDRYQGWNGWTQLVPSLENHTLQLSISGADPHFYSEDSLQLNASIYKYIRIRMMNPNPTESASVSWTTTADTAWSSVKSQSFAIRGKSMPTVAKGEFEMLGSNENAKYGPMTNRWTFNEYAGVQRNGSIWGAPDAPDGVQAAFIQGPGTISQSIAIEVAGVYKLHFKMVRRTGSAQTVNVYFDGGLIGTYTPSSLDYADFYTDAFATSPGNHTILFKGLTNNDNTVFIDGVSFVQ